MADPDETEVWAEQQFGRADLGDPRRTRRLVRAAARIAAHPEKMFNQIFDWNELRGFYRLCDGDCARYRAVLQPHWDNTRQAMRQQPLVLVLHDTTELDYSGHAKLTGIGPIGDGRPQGLLQHNSLAVLPSPRRVLGLAYQQLRVRQPAPAGETAQQRKRRPRESQMWLEGLRAAGVPPEGCCWVDVCDRGADDYEAMRAAREVGHHFLIRVTQNRGVFTSAALAEQSYALDYVRSLPGVSHDRVDIPGRGGRAARTAAVTLAAAPVWVPAPAGTPRRSRQPILAAWLVRIWEPEPPADVAEPLDWVLWCSLPSATPEELQQRRDWYCLRWLVEVYHHIEKNGCSEERRRFETADRMATCLAVLAVVAVRVFQMRTALEEQPEASAGNVATAAEIEVVARLTGGEAAGLTVRQFIYGVARLGGHLGRKSDGPPGVQALWRGYQRLQDVLQGFQLQAEQAPRTRPKDVGNR
jgi:Transposase DNA-binding